MAPEVLRNEPSNEKCVFYTTIAFSLFVLLSLKFRLHICFFLSGKSGPTFTVLESYCGNLQQKKSLGILSMQCRYCFLVTLSFSSLAGIFMNSFSNFLQVIGAVGFMNHRLEIPEDVDPQWTSIIESCWHTCDFFKLLHF